MGAYSPKQIDGISRKQWEGLLEHLRRLDNRPDLLWFKRLFLRDAKMPPFVWRRSKMREYWRLQLYAAVKKGQ